MSPTTPTTMRSALVHAGPRVELITTTVPKPGPGQLLLKVSFAGSNPKDWKRPTLMGQAPLNQGDDVSGTIEALGVNVAGFNIGQRVAAYHLPGSPFGTYAEYCIAEAWATWHIPDHMDMAEAATFPMTSMTAAVALWRELGIPFPWATAQREGIIIYGAGSGVSLFAVKLAKLSGMSPVIAAAGNDASRKLVASLLDAERGDRVVDYRNGEEATVEDIGAAVGSMKVRLALDAISSSASEKILGQLLDKSSGKARIATVLPLNAADELEGIARSFTISPLIFGDVKEARVPIGAYRWLGATIIKFIEMAVADGSLNGHPCEIIDGGLSGIEKGLKLLQAGSAKGACHLKSFAHSYRYKISEDTMDKNTDSGVSGGVKFVTSTLGNVTGGLARTVGGVVGAAGRGIGDTVTATTGNAGKAVGDGLGGAATGLEDGTNRVAKGVENAGQGKSSKHW